MGRPRCFQLGILALMKKKQNSTKACTFVGLLENFLNCKNKKNCKAKVWCDLIINCTPSQTSWPNDPRRHSEFLVLPWFSLSYF